MFDLVIRLLIGIVLQILAKKCDHHNSTYMAICSNRLAMPQNGSIDAYKYVNYDKFLLSLDCFRQSELIHGISKSHSTCYGNLLRSDY